VRPRDAAGKTRRRVAAELIADLERTLTRKKAADKELKELLAETGTSLTDLHGIGPSGAARLLVDVGDITRFPNRAHFASWTGTAPIDASSGDHVRHRLSRRGNRQINRVLHIMAVVQLRNPTEGRAYYDRKKADGKSSMEAMRCLKRRLSDLVYRQMVNDLVTARATGPGGQAGNDSDSSATGSHPDTSSSDKPLPGPVITKPRTTLSNEERTAIAMAPASDGKGPLRIAAGDEDDCGGESGEGVEAQDAESGPGCECAGGVDDGDDLAAGVGREVVDDVVAPVGGQ
jgi:transposase